MNVSTMFTAGVGVAGHWRTLRVAAAAAPAPAYAHHAIPEPKRRTAAAPVASVPRGLT
jgi:hypothetical protein